MYSSPVLVEIYGVRSEKCYHVSRKCSCYLEESANQTVKLCHWNTIIDFPDITHCPGFLNSKQRFKDFTLPPSSGIITERKAIHYRTYTQIYKV
jgi:hypothetical protein